jgi:hypothetical protein
MGPRIKKHLKLAGGGTGVEVVGPIGDWEPHVVSARFWVVVAQVQGEKIVVAIGDPDETYTPPQTEWDGNAQVGLPGVVLNPGAATAWAVASFKKSGNVYESYTWQVETHLHDESTTLPPDDGSA